MKIDRDRPRSISIIAWLLIIKAGAWLITKSLGLDEGVATSSSISKLKPSVIRNGIDYVGFFYDCYGDRTTFRKDPVSIFVFCVGCICSFLSVYNFS